MPEYQGDVGVVVGDGGGRSSPKFEEDAGSRSEESAILPLTGGARGRFLAVGGRGRRGALVGGIRTSRG
jgi:hypothetical protein